MRVGESESGRVRVGENGREWERVRVGESGREWEWVRVGESEIGRE